MVRVLRKALDGDVGPARRWVLSREVRRGKREVVFGVAGPLTCAGDTRVRQVVAPGWIGTGVRIRMVDTGTEHQALRALSGETAGALLASVYAGNCVLAVRQSIGLDDVVFAASPGEAIQVDLHGTRPGVLVEFLGVQP